MSIYERPYEPRRSPSPGPSRTRHYDDRHAQEPSYADRWAPGSSSWEPSGDYYRPDRWHDREADYYRPPLAPYPSPPRREEIDEWGRSIPWEPSQSPWIARPSSPPRSAGWVPPRDRDSYHETFEPSETWKKSHHTQSPSSVNTRDRHWEPPEYRRPDFWRPPHEELSGRGSHYRPDGTSSHHGDSYRPDDDRHGPYVSRPGSSTYDSYRPPYDPIPPRSAAPRMSAMGNYKRQTKDETSLPGDRYIPPRYDRSLSPPSSRERSLSPISASPRGRSRGPYIKRLSSNTHSTSNGRGKTRQSGSRDSRSSRSSRSVSTDSIRSSRSNSRQPPPIRGTNGRTFPTKPGAIPSLDSPGSAAVSRAIPLPSPTANPTQKATIAPAKSVLDDSPAKSVSKPLSSPAVAAANILLRPAPQDAPTQIPGLAYTNGTRSTVHAPVLPNGHVSPPVVSKLVAEVPLMPLMDKGVPQPEFTKEISPPKVASPPPVSSAPAPLTEEVEPAAMEVDGGAATEAPSDVAVPPQKEDNSNMLLEALRQVVIARLRNDRQTREEQVEPTIMANKAISEPGPTHPDANPQTCLRDGLRASQSLIEKHSEFRKTILQSLQYREGARLTKVERLREDYIARHRLWRQHCARLDASVAAAIQEEAPVTGRTTRRSAMLISDAVRSDLEMEQIIASLGVTDLQDANHMASRNAATIPDMLSVTEGRVWRYDDESGLVLDPRGHYEIRTGMHDWNEDEKKKFLQKYSQHPKQFGIIADSLEHKTAAQCVAYYYLHKKQFIDFKRAVKKGRGRAGNTRAYGRRQGGLMNDIRAHDVGVQTRRRRAAPKTDSTPGPDVKDSARPSGGSTPAAKPTPEPGQQPRKRGRPRIIRDDPPEGGGPPAAKKAKRGRKPKVVAPPAAPAPPAPKPAPVKVPEEPNPRKKGPNAYLRWTEEDMQLFMNLLAQHGTDFKRIAASMPNKTTIQVSNFYKLYSVSLNLENIAAGAPRRSVSPSSLPHISLPAVFGHPPPVLANTGTGEPVILEPPPMASLTNQMPQFIFKGASRPT